MVLVQTEDDPAPLLAIGRWYGHILLSVQGQGGFGYDPVFGVASSSGDGHTFSAAQMTAAEKGRVSHRGQALKDLVRQLRERDEGFTA
jgi:XTP/dITP diphosphohydrolase